ncbi:hypothetical protein L3X38_002876 [Prunus dulcis]|uniref:Uncharacterized protein n=1 Tax=Prunus dulcis TaxID=3755 RepID=A0AAD4WUT4_PRUDU|nr:hypothetical protein L3X38_002876 [Prunus dulcis]
MLMRKTISCGTSRTKLYYLDWAPDSETKVGQAFTTSGAVPRGRETKFDYGINVLAKGRTHSQTYIGCMKKGPSIPFGIAFVESFDEGLVVKATSDALDSDEGRVIQEIPRTQLRHLESQCAYFCSVLVEYLAWHNFE